MKYALLKNMSYGKVLSYKLYETVYETEEEFNYNNREVSELVNTFGVTEFENLLKKNDYDYLKTVNDLHYEKIDELFLGF